MVIYRVVYFLPKEKVLRFNPMFRIFYYTFETLLNKLMNYKDEARGVIDPIKEVVLALRRTLTLWRREKDFIAGWYSEIYPIIQFTISSINARYGNFIEHFLISPFENAEVKVKLGKIMEILNLGKYSFEKTKGKTDPNRKEIDMTLVRDDKVFFVEHRTSTEGGGKTGQESIFDKFVIFLEDTQRKLHNKPCFFDYLSKKFKEVFFVITIFFDKYGNIAKLNNPSVKGRIDSLIRYGNDILGKIVPMLVEKKMLQVQGSLNEGTIFSDWISGRIKLIYKRSDQIEKELSLNFMLLIGPEALQFYGIDPEIVDNEEKFSNYLLDVLSEAIADDFWILFSVLLNEIKLQKEFNIKKLPVEYIVEYVENHSTFREKIYNIVSSHDNLEDIWRELNSEISRELYSIVEYLKERMKVVRLIESNDVSQTLEYIKKEVYVGLMFYKFAYGDIR